MNKINILSSEIFNRIAAGEVVERPASIVKELVENSIDAGANVISIEIAQGGIKKIKVSDNGCGIYSDDIKSAFLPHATSKIENLCDLESIKTLGFRGEALSSIASIAQVEMISKTKDSCVGTKIEVSGGEISDLTEVAMTYGTTITVNNIFFNVPARAKFIKKPKSEESEITNYVTRLILANPEIQFKYIVDNETKIDYQSGSGLVHAIEILYGREIAKNLIPVQFENNDGIKLFGYVGRPEIAKSNRTYQTLIINGRYIINYMISAAIANAFSDYLMKGKFPFYVLNLEIPFEQVDINVHPSKLEAKFENSNAIFNLFSSVVFKALENINYTKEIESFVNEVNQENFENKIMKHHEGISFSPKIEEKIKIDGEKINFEIKNIDIFANENFENSFEQRSSGLAGIILDSLSTAEETGSSLGQKNSQTNFDINDFSFKIIGVLFNTYIICEKENEMFLIDQHAAHEREKYDKIMEQLTSNTLSVQTLLVPYIFNVNSQEQDFFEENFSVFKSIGFEIETFGNNSLKVNTVPYILFSINLKNYFDYILKDIKTLLKKPFEFIKETFTQMACKAATKGGDNLSEKEIVALLKTLDNKGKILLCPHGRPIIIKINKKEIEKWFKRIV